MYKLMIADDEPKIRDGLQKMLDWSSYNITIVGVAEDGETAFQLAKEKQPDIIFLDICMPFINGLDLVKKLNAEIDNCVIVIITGYTEFEYMQKAVQLKVFDYLLKPITKRGLEETLLKVTEEIQKNRQSSKYVNWVNEKMEESIDTMREKFFISLFKSHISKEQIDKDISFLKIDVDYQIGLLIMKVMQKSNVEFSSRNDLDENLMMYGIKNMASEILGDSDLYACFKDYLGNIVIVSNVRNVLGWTDACCKISLNVELYTDTLVLFEQGVIYDIMNVTSEYKNLCLKIKEKYSYTPVINSIVNYIERNCNIKDLSLEKTASLFRMSPSYMSKLLKSEIGNSFINILTKMRVQRAAALIGNSQIKMYEVAELVGYSNQYYFSRAFKKVMGLSPVQYKEGRTN